MTADLQRELDLDSLVLLSGGHKPDSKFCVMEAVAYVAGEQWTDTPQCACPVLGAFLRAWNDGMNDTDRQRLKPYIPRLVGTKSTAAVESRRSWMACDWLVRVFTVAWLRKVGLVEDADALASLPELTSSELAGAAMPAITKAKRAASAARTATGDAALAATWTAARAAAWDAALAATWTAAWAAARTAARAAAWDAAGDAARTAWDAALAATGTAAWTAAVAAALAAAWDAAREGLKGTVAELQTSAFDLLDRMIAVQP